MISGVVSLAWPGATSGDGVPAWLVSAGSAAASAGVGQGPTYLGPSLSLPL
jgi:hypothetical protein